MPADTDPHPAAAGSAPSGPTRLLLVDDNADAVASLAVLLELMGYVACVATSGREALERGAAFGPDAIVLDLGMPGMNGYEAAREIRATPWGRDALLVALTGWGQPEDVRRTRDAGFAAHLLKPLNMPDLLALLGPPPPHREPSP